jgi:hypothetical protein
VAIQQLGVVCVLVGGTFCMKEASGMQTAAVGHPGTKWLVCATSDVSVSGHCLGAVAASISDQATVT